MTREQMKKALNQAELVEKWFHRDLTEEEFQYLVENGTDKFYKKIGLEENDLLTMNRLFSLISTGFTKNEDNYEYELEQENYQAIPVLESLLSDLKYIQDEKEEKTGTNSYCGEYKAELDPELNAYFTPEAEKEAKESILDPNDVVNEKDYDSVFKVDPTSCSLGYIVDKLKSGESLELPNDVIQEIIDYLDSNNENYVIKAVNNKVTLKITTL